MLRKGGIRLFAKGMRPQGSPDPASFPWKRSELQDGARRCLEDLSGEGTYDRLVVVQHALPADTDFQTPFALQDVRLVEQ